MNLIHVGQKAMERANRENASSRGEGVRNCLFYSVLRSGPHPDMGGRESPQHPQGALADAPDGIGDLEGIGRLLGVAQGLPCLAEGLRRAMDTSGRKKRGRR